VLVVEIHHARGDGMMRNSTSVPGQTSPGDAGTVYEPTRTGLSADAIKRAFLDNLFYLQGRFPDVATPSDYYQALAVTVRDRMLQRWVRTAQTYKRNSSRTVSYLSAEYLPGPRLAASMLNLGIFEAAREALGQLGLDIDELIESEEEPGLGNGGLGRLAACFMDSMATLQVPAIGYGIRYEFGIFDQVVHDGWQVEIADKWLRFGNPWELHRPRIGFNVKLGGHTEAHTGPTGRYHVRWVPAEIIRGIANDTPVLGYGVNNANLLRLWSAEACESFDFQAFNTGEHYLAVHRKVRSETVSKVLYPNDEPELGKRLRLIQQHFLVSCSLQDMLRIYRQSKQPLERFHEKYAIQLNDTHPALAVAELMRLLVDGHGLDWDSAWDVTRRTFAYTNHTLLPEALEKWPISLVAELLPRHLEIVYELNRRFLDEVRLRFPYDRERVARLSLIDETPPRYVRMANLACLGSFAINGVAELHTRLLKETVLADFHALWPEKFSNKTNGVTPRRFLMLVNPGLRNLLTDRIGEAWTRDLTRLRALEAYADDSDLHDEWRLVKAERKQALTRYIEHRVGVKLDEASLFDIQVKRIHEYKRQHLNVLHVITLYNRIKGHPTADIVPRSFIFGGKAAPGYRMAKLIIKLIHSVADVVDRDPDVAGRLRVVFVPDFNVKTAQNIYPAADLSEQISLAGKEASGTGNMKFTLNGALTIGTLDGANVEIREEVGAENFFLFGRTAEEVMQAKREGYRPREYYESDPELRLALDLIAAGHFSGGDRELFQPLVEHLLDQDEYMLLADYRAYVDCQAAVSEVFRDQGRWTRMSILNVARSGKFSSDRAIREYCKEIWKVSPVPVELSSPTK
jgi:starch phosphorylase